MTSAWRAVTSTIVTVAVTLIALRIISSANSAMALLAPENGIQITAVPTLGHRTMLAPALSSVSGTGLPATDEILTIEPSLIPRPLFDPAIRLQTGAVDVPLELQIPALKIEAPVLGVGLTLTNAMASPVGMRPNDPVWQSVFWYRGGGIPGEIGTATFAGHYDDDEGRPAVFAFLGDLRIGDLIIVRDARSDVTVPFIVTETKKYTNQEAADPAVLERIFGSESVRDLASRPVSDHLSHLTLITCGGEWVNGSFNRRLVVYAIRASYPPESA